ncbi:hypothetical protein MNBD_DELTA02-752 [hydrothermal vent metagenome]|uniref:Uncharacterized protein n=1 Tax=hydrothermal vent metagenome TaxID=652676 RepID=A0A3B0VM16_9ZZZZ
MKIGRLVLVRLRFIVILVVVVKMVTVELADMIRLMPNGGDRSVL